MKLRIEWKSEVFINTGIIPKGKSKSKTKRLQVVFVNNLPPATTYIDKTKEI